MRGPLGGHFVWSNKDGGPLLLIGGGSGVVPLVAMIRHRTATANRTPTVLMLSARKWDDIPFRQELLDLHSRKDGCDHGIHNPEALAPDRLVAFSRPDSVSRRRRNNGRDFTEDHSPPSCCFRPQRSSSPDPRKFKLASSLESCRGARTGVTRPRHPAARLREAQSSSIDSWPVLTASRKAYMSVHASRRARKIRAISPSQGLPISIGEGLRRSP